MAEKIDLQEGVKPVTGAPSSFGQGTTIRQLDDEGRIKAVRTSGAPLDTRNVKTPQEAANPERIGDYYYDSAKNLQVWENSPTDLLQKYRVAIGGTEKPAELLSPSGEALSILGPAAGTGMTVGAVAGGPVGAAVGAVAGLIGGLTNFNNAREEALRRWQEENVKYDSAVEFYKDDDGSIKYNIDYQKMGTGGPRSGERVKEAQNRETQVSLGDDGRLKVRVSPIFASTARFQEMMDFISTNYGGLSKDTENLDQILDEIKNGIDGEAQSYISNMRLYADFAQKFQNASPETIVASYTTEMAGYVDPSQMKDYQVFVLGDGDVATTKSAEEFFNSVLSMDKTGRNDLATKLNDIVYGESNNYSDDQRAIAYGELQAIYAASANPEEYEGNKYQGMMDADGFVSFMNSFAPLGLSGGDVLKFLSGGAYSKQEMLNPDEWAQFFGGAAGIGAGFGLWKGGTSLIEAALKRLPGTARLYAASVTGQGIDKVRALFAAGEIRKGVAAWAAEAGFKTLKIGVFDAALAGAQTAVSNEDFWSNFGEDFVRDAALEAIFSYYDMARMRNAINDNTVYVYVDKETGQLRRLNEYKGEEFTAYEVDDDGLLTETTYKEGLKTNVWQTEKGGTGAVLQTPGGTTVTVIDGEVKYTPGGKVVEGEVVDVTEAFNEIPVMSTGVVNTSEGPLEVSTLLERAGLPKDTQVFEMSESSANAAMVAGKIAKVQTTKVGMEIYKQLFNKNGVLDVANNMALARDGDLNSWRNAQEYFVSVQNNAMRNLQDIQNGVYFKDAASEWAKTIELMGKFNYEYKYKPKTDGAYINAILNIERAELLNKSRVEGDTTDYVAKALEVYGDVLAKMPADRGALLQEWVQQGKKWLKAFNESVKKSGKVDIEKLENVIDTDIDSEVGWFPVWGKKQTYMGLLDSFRGITKERNPYKSWLRDGEWVPADQLGDPWQNMTRYMGFVTNNMGLNDMIEQASIVYDRAGLLVDNTPTDATIRKRKLESIKNKDELNKKLDDMIADVKKEVEERTMTPAEYSDAMTKIYEESAIPEIVEALGADLGSLRGSGLSDVDEKRIANKIKRLKEAAGPLAQANEIYSAEKIIKRVGKRNAKELDALVKETKSNLEKSGYRIGGIEAGRKMNDGLNVDVMAFEGSGEYISEVIKPMVTKDGKIVQRAKIVLGDPIPEPKAENEKADIIEWSEFWKNAPAQTRKDIRNELEKTSLQTGYGIKDTRARLNAQVPGANVLDWSLLGREHVNGLAPEIGYAGMKNPVKAYIMSIDDLAKLAGYDLDNAIPDMGKVIEKNINTKGGVPMIPAHIRGSGDGPEVWLKMRWGNNSDGVANWTDYLKTLKERGIEKVPVAIDDARGSDFNSVFYQVRNSGIAQKGMENIVAEIDRVIANGEEPNFKVRDISAAMHLPGMSRGRLRKRIRGSLPSSAEEGVSFIGDNKLNVLLEEAEGYDWAKDKELNNAADNIENIVKKKLGRLPQDITSELTQAFEEQGEIPLYHNQDKPYGSLEYNEESSVPEGEGIYTAEEGVGDALWIAPNASYTDEYGKNKLMGTIPVKYFMSDKEMRETADRLGNELAQLKKKAYDKGIKKMEKADSEILKNLIQKTLKGSGSSLTEAAEKNYLYPVGYDEELNDLFGVGGYFFNELGLIYKESHTRNVDSSKGGEVSYDVTFTPMNKLYHTPQDYKFAEENGVRELSKKDKDKYDKLAKIVEPGPDGSSEVISYRALAEYVKKPVIDTTIDMKRKKNINGTAYFYYKGVDPKFDKGLGKQLEIQAAGTPVWPESLAEEMVDEWTSEHTLGDFLNFVKEEAPESSANVDALLRKLENGKSRGDSIREEFDLADMISKQLENSHPEMSHFMHVLGNRIYSKSREGFDLSMSLMEMGMDKSRFYSEHSAESFLEEIGEENPDYVTPKEKAAWEAINPRNIANVPTEPQFVQPRKVSYEDFERGAQADPDMPARIQSSYRAAMADRLIKEATRVVGLAEDYLSEYGYGADWQSYLNTSLIPDLQNAINQNMLPDEFSSFVQARMAQAIQDVAPYQSPELLLKSRLDGVAQEWRDWALKHIKAGRATQKDLKEFVNSHNLELPNDKRPYPAKVKHALWEMVQNNKRLPEIEGLDLKKLEKKQDSEEVAFAKKRFADAMKYQERMDWLRTRFKETGNIGYRQEADELIDLRNECLADAGVERVHAAPANWTHEQWWEAQHENYVARVRQKEGGTTEKSIDKEEFYKALDETPLFQSATKDKNELLDLLMLERNGETTDGFTMGVTATAAGLGGRFPITWFKGGKPYTRFIKYDTPEHLLIAEQTTKALNDKELLKEDGLISKALAFVANDFRLLTTGWDPSRALPNLTRDTSRSFVLGKRFINAKKMLQSVISSGSYTPAQRKKLEQAIENAANAASNSSYNSAYRTPKAGTKEITKEYLSRSGASPMKRFFYNVVHDKRSILEWPMEFFEGYSRRANARSLAAIQLAKDQTAGANFSTQFKNAVIAAEWAGREYTANFQRKGELIGRVSKYVAYQSSAYAGFDGMIRAFINDPKAVSRNFAAFVLAFLVLLADTLSREETRTQYYRLSEYDRENQIVIGMGDSILTIPIDQELAGMLFPYRRIMETLNGTDPVSFFEFVWGTLTAALPPDLSGFSEGDGFNLSRGLEKLTAQNMPNFFTPIQEAATGYDLYYGSNLRVTDETLKDYGIYSPEPGDYTTTGKDSALLRQVANTAGIPQWQLQVMLDGYGGNVGKYVLNIIDKLSGATKDQQGGKDFANTVFNSFTGLDQDAASNAFYSGITQLKDEKNKLIQKLAGYNEDLKTASGDAKVELQGKIAKAKQDYGTKVGDFVDKYVSAYEITGGLPKSQAQQIYYLFRLDDDDTLYQSGSVEEYYNNQAVQQFKNQATAMSAPILDKYYNNRLGNIYQDSEGVWRRYLSSGAQAMKNSVYGIGEQQKVDLLNILEGKDSNMKALRTQVKNARNQAYEAGDWDTRDALAYEFDKQVLQAISPYIEQYGAENVLGNTDVLEYLSEWFIVPDDFIRTKKGKNVSLGNNASTQKAFVQPFIKYIFGLPTNFSSYSETSLTGPKAGEF